MCRRISRGVPNSPVGDSRIKKGVAGSCACSHLDVTLPSIFFVVDSGVVINLKEQLPSKNTLVIQVIAENRGSEIQLGRTTQRVLRGVSVQSRSRAGARV
jgi:hypothetical protein